MATVTKRTCKATNRRGQPCRRLATTDGLCLVHSGGQDMKALGRAGGKARHRPGKQLPADQRDTVRAELRKIDPATVRAGVEEALASGNVTAKVQAVRLLSDLEVYSREGEGCWRCAQAGAEVARLTANCKILYGVLEAEYKVMAREKADWQYVLEQLELLTVSMMNGKDPIVVVNDVSAERAAEILEHLEEVGLIRRGSKAFTDEKAALRQEREALDHERAELKAMRQELSPA